MSNPQKRACYEELLAKPDVAVFAKDALVSLGECIVTDVYDGGELPPPLPPEIAVKGAGEVEADTSTAAAAAQRLEQSWDLANTQEECDGLASGLLRVRIEAWYATEALDYLADTAQAPIQGRLLQAAASLDQATTAFDKLLVKHLDILSILVATPWLKKWRQELPTSHELPWWLDGTLEAEAIRIGREADQEPRLALPQGGASTVITLSDILPIRRHRDDALRHAITALAAAAPAGAPMKTIAWTLPGSTLTATLYVPSRITEGDQLSMHLGDEGDGSASHADGTIVFLNGRPACWRLSRDVTGDFITASWSWDEIRDLSQSRELTLQDGQTGAEWSRADSHTRA